MQSLSDDLTSECLGEGDVLFVYNIANNEVKMITPEEMSIYDPWLISNNYVLFKGHTSVYEPEKTYKINLTDNSMETINNK